MRYELCLLFLSDPMPNWYLYIVRCRDGSLYTGIATDVESRLADHRANKGAKYLRGRGPLKLVFKKQIGKKGCALKIEQKVKNLPRQKKEALIRTGAGIEALLSDSKPGIKP
jgi:putative endonuclease